MIRTTSKSRLRQCKASRRSIGKIRSLSAAAVPEVETSSCSPLATTQLVQPHFDRQEPLLLRGLLSSTPKNRLALQQFGSWEFWQDTVDVSTDCHVEIGGNYSSSPIASIPFAQFVSYLLLFQERHGKGSREDSNSNSGTAPPQSTDLVYLAQNDVFPEIAKQIDVPDFCTSVGQGQLYSTLIWIGPHGCISPLHYDPLDNVLLQYVGRKKIFLCPPNSPVQAGAKGNQKNTSPLNPELVIARGNVENIPFQETTLRPGDALYMPAKWYHHVTTVETSVSINFWFR